MDPLDLDWGAVTPELVNESEGIALHVVNVDLGDAASVRRACRFLVGRAHWFARQLPAGWLQQMRIDDRGQTVFQGARSRLREALTGLADLSFMSEDDRGV